MPSLRACRYHKVLRLFRSRIMNAVQFIGVNERCGSRPDQRCLALDGHSHAPFHEQKQFFVLVPVGRMRLASRSQCGLVHFEMLACVQGSIEDCPGLVLPIFLTGRSL